METHNVTDFTVILTFFQTIAWPVVTFILFRYFASPLKELIEAFTIVINERGIKLTKSGVEIPAPIGDPENILESIKAPYYNTVYVTQKNKLEPVEKQLNTQSGNIQQVLEKHEENLVERILATINNFLLTKNNNTSDENMLKGLLCDAYICLYFERCFQRILGSQLKLLFRLKQAQSGLPSDVAKSLYARFYTNSTVINYEEWLSFLELSSFISKTNDQLALTKEGEEFIKYLQSRNYSLMKAG